MAHLLGTLALTAAGLFASLIVLTGCGGSSGQKTPQTALPTTSIDARVVDRVALRSCLQSQPDTAADPKLPSQQDPDNPNPYLAAELTRPLLRVVGFVGDPAGGSVEVHYVFLPTASEAQAFASKLGGVRAPADYVHTQHNLVAISFYGPPTPAQQRELDHCVEQAA
jgi:hypothetical protein